MLCVVNELINEVKQPNVSPTVLFQDLDHGADLSRRQVLVVNLCHHIIMAIHRSLIIQSMNKQRS